MRSSDPDNMRRIALRGTLFLLPVLLGWGVLEGWLNHVPDSHSIKHANLLKLEPEIDTLVLGASASFWDIAPRELDGNAYNLGNVAQTLYYDDALLTKALPRLPKLKRVILSVTYVSLFFQLHDTDEETRQYYYWHRWHIPPPRVQDRLDPKLFSLVALRTPGFAASSFKDALMRRVHGGEFATAPFDSVIDAYGWSPQPAGNPKDLQVEAVNKKLFYHHRLMHLSDEDANAAALEHIISLTQSRGIELVLVVPPVYAEYAKGMKPEYWQRTQERLLELSRRQGVRYLNFLEAPDLSAEDFLDADHLNANGALEFTRMLRTELVNQQGHPPSS